MGPRNDVSILWRALTRRDLKFDNIAVLTNGLPETSDFPRLAGVPHRAQILAELDKLTERAAKGDTVIFYYSGHGSVQPVNPDIPQEPNQRWRLDFMSDVLVHACVGLTHIKAVAQRAVNRNKHG